MTISIVLITRNRKDELKKTLSHLFSYEHYFNEIILVDNGSTDGTPDMVMQEFPKVRLIRLHKNFGVCAARNIGAVNATNELLLFLDDDGYFDMRTIPMLVEQFKADEKLAFAGCHIVNLPVAEADKLDFATFRPSLPEVQPSHTFEGTAFMTRKSLFVELGGFPDYFFYSNEENDISLRAIKRGYKVIRLNHAVMLHYSSPRERPNTRRTYYYSRNVLFQIWRNFPVLYAIKESIFVIAGGLLRAFANKQLFAFVQGTAAAIIRLPIVVLRERRPLTYAQYRIYTRLRGENIRLSRRVKKLLRDLQEKIKSRGDGW